MRIRAWFLPFLLYSVSACAIGPHYARPEVPVPGSWRDAPSSTSTPDESLERWWTTFQDPVLDSLTSRAVAGNVDLKIAAARIQEARAARGIAAAAGLPQVGASADLATLAE